ncbi:MAG TPA: acetate uptake transporter [Ktedonobacteraceae bacterium]|nr:acetate uptake transporter [Ktedonobacteraceae bacterium]
MAQIAAERAESAAPAVADPAPLGLSAFALTTFVLSSSNAGFIFPKVGAGGAAVLGLAIFYGGLVQIIAGVWEFRRNNVFGATAFCSYGGFWMALGFTLLPGSGIAASLIADKSLTTGIGVFLLGWTIFTGLMFIGTLRLTLAHIVVFGLLFLTFLCLTIGFLSGAGGASWIQIGGWLGIVTALAAWYLALTVVLSSVKLVNLPTMPMNRS